MCNSVFIGTYLHCRQLTLTNVLRRGRRRVFIANKTRCRRTPVAVMMHFDWPDSATADWRRHCRTPGVARDLHSDTRTSPDRKWDGMVAEARGIWPPPKSTQPCTSLRSLNRVPASAEVKAETSPLPDGHCVIPYGMWFSVAVRCLHELLSVPLPLPFVLEGWRDQTVLSRLEQVASFMEC